MIPKSLHTITAIARVAQHVLATDPEMADADVLTACDWAAQILGYANVADDYGLIAKAAAVIVAGKVK